MMMMIKTRIYYCYLFLLVLFASTVLHGQTKDFMTWYEAEFDMNLIKKVDLSTEIEQRFRNNSLSYDRTMLTFIARYDITDFLDIAGGVRAFLTTGNERHLETRYRLHLDARGSHSLGALGLSLRIRMHYGVNDLNEIDLVSSNNLVYRNSLEADYHIFGTRFGVFASVESYHLLSGNPPRKFNKMRYKVGTNYELNLKSELSLRYMLEDEFNVVEPLQAHILVLGYSMKL